MQKPKHLAAVLAAFLLAICQLFGWAGLAFAWPAQPPARTAPAPALTPRQAALTNTAPGAVLSPEGPAPDPDQAGAWAGGRHPAQASPHRPRFIVLHWTAGGWSATFPQYHFNILGNGKVVATYPVGFRGAHVWKRNTGAVGIALCAGAGARVVNGALVGTKAPIQPVQLEAMAATVAEVALDHGIPTSGNVDVGFGFAFPWLTGHHFWAVKDGYGPDRSELGVYEATVRSKAAWYVIQYRDKGRAFQHTRKGLLRRAFLPLVPVRSRLAMSEVPHAKS